jgi:outer membrane protein OmpA-like peptidoglycan-associated protein
MIGNVLRFRVKRTLVGIAALSLLVPMSSHADVTPGRWIFDGFSRSTRDGKGATCVGTSGDTHAFDAPSCNGAASEAKAAAESDVNARKARKAAQDAEAAKRAAAMKEAKEFLPGGQNDFRVRRNDGIKLTDGFGRECVMNGAPVSGSTGDCTDPTPQGARGVDSIIKARRATEQEARASKAAAAAAASALPMVPGAALSEGQKGAYVYRPAGSTLRDGYGRSCVKDGIWHPAFATEECHPDLYNDWAAKSAPPEPELLKRVQMPPPEMDRGVAASAAPAPAPTPESAPAIAAPVSAPAALVDDAPAVFPVTTYAIDGDAAAAEALPTVAALATASEMETGDEDDEVIAESDENVDDEDGTPVALAAAEDDEASADPDASLLAATGDDEDDGDVPANPEEDDDDETMPFLAGDMRDEDDTALALDDDESVDGDDDALLDEDDVPSAALMTAGADDDDDEHDDSVASEDQEDDTETAYLGDEDAPESDDIPMVAMVDGDDADEPVFASEDDEDEPVFASEDDEDDTETAYLGDEDAPEPDGIPMVAMVDGDDDDEPVFASEDDTETAYLGDDDVSESNEAPMAAIAVADDDDEPVFADEDDGPAAVFADEPAALVATPDVMVPDATPPATKVARTAPVDEKPAEFPVTLYEVAADPEKTAEPVVEPAVNAACPPTTIQMEEGRFAFDRFNLRPEVLSKLDAIADLLKSAKCDAILITGHTDRIGTSKYNKRLSERRAAAAKAYLVTRKGIDPALVSVAGVGEGEAVTTAADCKGKRKKALIACYAPDRRVVITATTRKPAN